MTGDKNIEDIVHAYDPLNIIKNMLYMIAWTVPVPYTTPIYVYINGENLYLSLKKLDLQLHNDLPMIFVLTNPNDNYNTIFGKNEFKIEHGKPRFTFSRDFGRCIPDVNSNDDINECLHDFKVTFDDTTLLGYFKNKIYYKTDLFKIIFVGILILIIFKVSKKLKF